MRSSSAIFILLLAVFRLCAESATATFRTATSVRSEGVFSTDLIEGVPGLPKVRVADAPAAGASLIVKREDVLAALAKSGFEAGVTNWAGPVSARVSRLMRELGEAELRDLLTFEMQRRFARDRGEIEIRFTRPWRAVSIPDENFELKIIDSPGSALASTLSVRFELHAKEDVLGQWFQPVSVRHWCDMPVAVAAIRRGTPLQDAEITFERRDILAVRAPLVRLPENAVDYEFAEAVGTGQPLGERCLRLRTVITRGKMVDALVRSGPMEITTKVEALEDGAPGQMIRIRNTKSKREFRGRVQGEDSVLVPL